MFKKMLDMIMDISFLTLRDDIKGLVDDGIDYLQLKIEGVNTDTITCTLTDFVMDKIKLPLVLKPFKGLMKNFIKRTVEEKLEFIKDMALGV